MALTRLVSPELVEDIKRGGDKLREQINAAMADPARCPRYRVGPNGELLDRDGNPIAKPHGTVK